MVSSVQGARFKSADEGAGQRRGRRSSQVISGMESRPSPLDGWSPQEVARGRAWVATWREAGPRLEAIRQRELRELDTYAAIAQLCGTADYHVAPRAPSGTSGLIEQQRLFSRLRRP